MRRKAIAIATSALAFTTAVTPQQASAQFGSGIVVCTNCSNVTTQLLQQAQQAEQLINQAAQLQQQIQSYANMVQNTASLPAKVIGDVKSNIDRVRNIYSQAKGLAYTASNLSDQFTSRYKSLDSYLASGMSSSNMKDKYRQWSDETNDSVLNTMKALNAQADGMDDEYALLDQLKGQLDSADGQKEALDVANELSMESVHQTMRLRELIMQQVQMQAQAMQTAADKEATDRARAATYFKPSEAEYKGETF